MEERYTQYMLEAIKEAQKALENNEVPVGCVIVKNDKIIGRGHNQKERNHDVTAHAEILAIKEAQKQLNSWRLTNCELFVTLEPCVMCAGAIYQARIKRVIYGAKDPKAGALGGLFDLYQIPKLNHYPLISQGLMENECATILEEFFKAKRK